MEANLLKLDELGQDDPTMIRMMEDMTGVDAKEIPLSDPETMSIFTSPEALGLPDEDPIIGKTGTIESRTGDGSLCLLPQTKSG